MGLQIIGPPGPICFHTVCLQLFPRRKGKGGGEKRDIPVILH